MRGRSPVWSIWGIVNAIWMWTRSRTPCTLHWRHLMGQEAPTNSRTPPISRFADSARAETIPVHSPPPLPAPAPVPLGPLRCPGQPHSSSEFDLQTPGAQPDRCIGDANTRGSQPGHGRQGHLVADDVGPAAHHCSGTAQLQLVLRHSSVVKPISGASLILGWLIRSGSQPAQP